MDNDVAVFAQVMTVIVVTVAALVGIFIGARAMWLAGSRAKPVKDARVDERLERIEAAVDVIAIEVERISESQRFTAALLSERLPPRDRVGELPGASAAKRANNTPH